MHGVATLTVEVVDISNRGFCVRLGEEALHVPHERFPFFAGASEQQIRAVERPTTDHLYWPQLDIDLSVESLRDPGAFPLISRAKP